MSVLVAASAAVQSRFVLHLDFDVDPMYQWMTEADAVSPY